MDREISPEALQNTLDELSYPALRPDAAAELKEVTIVVDGEEWNLGAAISETDLDAYDDAAELRAAIEERIPDALLP